MSEEQAPLGHVDEYLKIGQEYDCSDVHLATNAQPSWRRFGVLQPIWQDAQKLTGEYTKRMV